MPVLSAVLHDAVLKDISAPDGAIVTAVFYGPPGTAMPKGVEAMKWPNDKSTLEAGEKRYKIWGLLVQPLSSGRQVEQDKPAAVDQLAEMLLSGYAERERDMVVRRANGETLDQIGKAHGLSRQRVHQIIAKALDKAS